MIRTFAPSEMHWSACVFCFWGSPWALTTRAATPAFLKAFCRYGLSNCSQRTEVFVSGIRPQARMPADVLAVAPVTMTTSPAVAATPATVALRERCFTYFSSLLTFLPGLCFLRVAPVRSLIHGGGLVKSQLGPMTPSGPG